MKGFLRLAIILSVLFSLGPSKAQAEPSIPEDLRQNWGLPDCRATEQILLFTEDRILTFTERLVGSVSVIDLRKIDDYWLVQTSGGAYAASISADGVLTMGSIHPAIFDGGVRPDWSTLPFDRRDEYMNCVELPAGNPTVETFKAYRKPASAGRSKPAPARSPE